MTLPEFLSALEEVDRLVAELSALRAQLAEKDAECRAVYQSYFALEAQLEAALAARCAPEQENDTNGDETYGHVPSESRGRRADLRAQSAGQNSTADRADVGRGAEAAPDTSRGEDPRSLGAGRSDGAMADAEVPRLDARRAPSTEQLTALVHKWRYAGVFKDTGPQMSSEDCANELAALLVSDHWNVKPGRIHHRQH
jgi:hypothetical protein